MFTRSSSTEPKPLEAGKPSGGSANGAQQHQQRTAPVARAQTRPGEVNNFSVISNDLRIIGQDLKIITQGSLQVDGEVEGDIRGNEIIIGELGQVRGTVAAGAGDGAWSRGRRYSG